MGRNSREDAELTRECIIHEALSLYSEQGYERTSFVAVANKLGLSKGAIFGHFPTKKDLLLAVMDHGLERRHQKLSVSQDSISSLAEFRQVFVDSLVRVLEDPGLRKFELVLGFQMEWSEEMLDELRAYRKELRRDFKMVIYRVLEKLQQSEPQLAGMDIDHTAQGLFSYWQGTVRMALIHQQSAAQVADYAEHFFNQYMKGISN